MLTYFVKNRHGYVTVMLIAMLISVLFFNTSFLEIARYKSLEKLYGEIQENAAFSVLANYDRDLFEKFGLLAVEDDIDNEKLYEYIQANINQGELASNLNLADAFLGESKIEADLQKLYFLSQRRVFESQVNEFCAYRAPISMVNNAMDLEATLKALIENLEDSLAGLNDFTEFMEAAGEMIDAFKDMIGFAKEIKENYLPAVATLTNAIESFNEAVQEREDLKEQIRAIEEANEEAIENGNYDDVVDTSGLEAQLLSTYGKIEGNANTVKNAIIGMTEKTGEYLECLTKFKDSFKTMKEKESEWTLENAKKNKNTGEMAQNMDSAYKESKTEIQPILDKTEPYGKEYFEGVENQMKQAEAQLDGDGETMTKISINKEDPFGLKMNGTVEDVKNEIEKNVEETEKELDKKESKEEGNSLSVADVIKIVRLLVEIRATGGTYNIECTEHISNDVNWAQITMVNNDYAQQDAAYVDGLLTDVEATLDISIDTDEETFGSQTMSSLEEKLKILSEKTDSLQDTFENFEITNKSLGNLLEQLGNVIGVVIDFFVAAIAAINELISFAIEGLMQIIFEKTFAATYATEMFTNRSSSIGDDTRLNGSEYTDYGINTNGEVFVMANAEYIYSGTVNEVGNQMIAFASILGLRIFANIPAILTDPGLKTAASGIAAIPYVGPLLSVLFYALIIIVEAYLDMIFMIYGDEGVSIIKMKGYLNFEGRGVDELTSQLESIIDKLDVEIEDSKGNATKSLKSELKSTLSGVPDGLTKWDYKQHLFLALCLFKSASTMYAREAKLIQLQLDKEKEEDFRLSNMATFVRTDTTVYYDPLLPVPYYGEGIPIRKLYYTGY